MTNAALEARVERQKVIPQGTVEGGVAGEEDRVNHGKTTSKNGQRKWKRVDQVTIVCLPRCVLWPNGAK